MRGFHFIRFIVLAASLIFVGAPSFASEGRYWVEAVGVAPMQKNQSLARRHAIAEALLSASLSGGASLQGYSVVDKARVVADRFMMRPTRTIIRYEMVSEGQSGNYWQVKLKALVGPTQVTGCDESRRLTVALFPASVTVSPYAPAWSQQIASTLTKGVADQLNGHARISVDVVSHLNEADLVSPQRAAFDYDSLTQGRIVVSAADQGVKVSTKADMMRGQNGTRILQMSVTLARSQNGSYISQDTVSSQMVLKQGFMSERLNGSKRKQAETHFIRDLSRQIDQILTGWTCRPPVARLAVSGSEINVPLGSRHGLSKTSLAFLADPSASLDVFEIVSLGRKSAKLRAISPSAGLSSFHNKQVRFLRTEF